MVVLQHTSLAWSMAVLQQIARLRNYSERAAGLGFLLQLWIASNYSKAPCSLLRLAASVLMVEDLGMLSKNDLKSKIKEQLENDHRGCRPPS
jgi:hypothetical protein